MEPKGIFIKDEEDILVNHMNDMLRLEHPLAPTNVKMKVVELIQFIANSFKERIR